MWYPWLSRASGCSRNGVQEFSFCLSPPRMAVLGAARGSPRFPGERRDCGAGLVLARLYGTHGRQAGRPSHHECLGSGVFSAKVAPHGRVPCGAFGQPASWVAEHRRPWGRMPRKTFWRGGGAPSSCAWSGWECPGKGWLRATAIPGDSEALLGLLTPRPRLLGKPWGSSVIPPARHGGPSKHRPRRWSRMSMEAMDRRTDRAVDGDCGQTAASSWLLGSS